MTRPPGYADARPFMFPKLDVSASRSRNSESISISRWAATRAIAWVAIDADVFTVLGEMVAGLTFNSSVWKTSSAQIVCIQVVPHWGGCADKDVVGLMLEVGPPRAVGEESLVDVDSFRKLVGRSL